LLERPWLFSVHPLPADHLEKRVGLKQGKVKGVRFETLEKICQFLQCQPGDILKYEPERS